MATIRIFVAKIFGRRRNMWTDYLPIVPSIAAVANGLIAVFVAQFYKDNMRAKIILVTSAAVLSCAAIGATVYGQYDVIQTRKEDQNRKSRIRDKLAIFINDGHALMVKCADVNTAPPKEDADKWNANVSRYLNDELGGAYVVKFYDRYGIPLSVPAALSNGIIPGNPLHDHFEVFQKVADGVFRLGQISEPFLTPQGGAANTP